LKTKDGNMLISPAIFDPEKCEGSKRAVGNIVFVRGLWLDFEGGDLKPDDSIYVPGSFETTSPAPRGQGRGPDQARVEAAIAEWRTTPKGEGDSAFFKLAVELKKAGMGDGEIEATLSDEARHARSPGERQRQIPSIMRSLRRGS